MKIGIKDKRVIKAFLQGKADHDGYKLDTDGRRLDGLWMGGSNIAARSALTGLVSFNDLGSRAAQTVQSAVRRMCDPVSIDPSERRVRKHRAKG